MLVDNHDSQQNPINLTPVKQSHSTPQVLEGSPNDYFSSECQSLFTPPAWPAMRNNDTYNQIATSSENGNDEEDMIATSSEKTTNGTDF